MNKRALDELEMEAARTQAMRKKRIQHKNELKNQGIHYIYRLGYEKVKDGAHYSMTEQERLMNKDRLEAIQ